MQKKSRFNNFNNFDSYTYSYEYEQKITGPCFDDNGMMRYVEDKNKYKADASKALVAYEDEILLKRSLIKKYFYGIPLLDVIKIFKVGSIDEIELKDILKMSWPQTALLQKLTKEQTDGFLDWFARIHNTNVRCILQRKDMLKDEFDKRAVVSNDNIVFEENVKVKDNSGGSYVKKHRFIFYSHGAYSSI